MARKAAQPQSGVGISISVLAGSVAAIWLFSPAKTSSAVSAQQPAETTGSASQSDPAAVAALQRAVAAYGRLAGGEPVTDFTAQGTITYFWAGQEVQGLATVRGRAPDQFRLDANLPEGVRSYAVSGGQGTLKDVNGKVRPIPYHNTINCGIETLPFFDLQTRLGEALTTIKDMGVSQAEKGRTLRQIRVQRYFTTAVDPDGTLAKLTVADYFVDPETNLVAKVVDMTHPAETLTRSFPHQFDFDSYTSVSGVNVPMVVRDKVAGQTIWQLKLSGIEFNVGLGTADFALQ